MYFEPDRSPGDIFLFEVIDGFGAGNIDEDRKLFEVAYASTPISLCRRANICI